MRIVEAQERVDEWINQFEEGYWPPLSMLASLTEEVGELAREINHREKIKRKKETEEAKSLGLGLADVFFSLICIANYYEVDLDKQLEEVIDKYSQRDKNRWTKKTS
ncbi:nucleotide pyrophosphohydrolase [Candidatus Bathyarchaeota archaeon]|nr:nucleotide pyrophosphohydrolase [Candidatus Bathyarchaeota archaeon]